MKIRIGFLKTVAEGLPLWKPKWADLDNLEKMATSKMEIEEKYTMGYVCHKLPYVWVYLPNLSLSLHRRHNIQLTIFTQKQTQHQETRTYPQPHHSPEALLHNKIVDRHNTSPKNPIPKAHTPIHAETGQAKQEPPKPVQQPKQSATATKFQAYYLQRITTEFADDLDKLRQSEDFGIGHLEMLRMVLGQGVEAWDEGEMARVVGSIWVFYGLCSAYGLMAYGYFRVEGSLCLSFSAQV